MRIREDRNRSIMSLIATIIKASIGIILVVILVVQYDKYINTANKGHPHAGLDVDKLIIEYGYPVEIHEITTEDGYILSLHRIPYSKEGKEDNYTRNPVLLTHCLTCAAVDFVSSGADRSLATLLSDNGYDVWLFNARGTTWSRRHVNLNPDTDSKFWDFSWHEIGLYDVAQTIDHILKITGRKNLHYVGMSQGTTSLFVLLSEKPEYNKKIRIMVGLGPAVIFDTPRGPVLRFLTRIRNMYKVLRDYFGVYEYFYNSGFCARYMRIFCNKNSAFNSFCSFIFSIIIGFNDKELDKDQLEVIYSVTLAGSSSKQIEHYLQLVYTSNFTKFDYGKDKNLEIYKQEAPPTYDLSKVKIPVALYYSEGDWIINPNGVKRLISYLPNVVKEYVVPDEDFTHNDFLYARNIRKLVYWSVLEELNKY